MIKAIIFDCFGVLVENSLNHFCDLYLKNDDKKLEEVRLYDTKANKGQISYTQLVDKLSELANVSNEETTRVLDDNPTNTELLEFIEARLKPHYKIGFLSNVSDDWLDDFFTPEQKALFDDIVLSFQHGIAKPDPEIFRLAAKRLGVNTSECVLVDDNQLYCTGALTTDMRVICYTSFEQFQAELEKMIDI